MQQLSFWTCDMPATRSVNCPRCGTPMEWGPAAHFRPFCSERCKLIDLGAWATERYRMPENSDESEHQSKPDQEPE